MPCPLGHERAVGRGNLPGAEPVRPREATVSPDTNSVRDFKDDVSNDTNHARPTHGRLFRLGVVVGCVKSVGVNLFMGGAWNSGRKKPRRGGRGLLGRRGGILYRMEPPAGVVGRPCICIAATVHTGAVPTVVGRALWRLVVVDDEDMARWGCFKGSVRCC